MKPAQDRDQGLALAFSFGIVVALIAVIVGARLPGQLTEPAADHPH